MPDLSADRRTLHRVAAHVLGRRRHQVSGRFGLRATPGGFGTPAFGGEPETVRVSGTTLVREVSGDASYLQIAGSSFRALAEFAGADVSAPFSRATPPTKGCCSSARVCPCWPRRATEAGPSEPGARSARRAVV